MSDDLERVVEIVLSIGVTGTSMYALFKGLISGDQFMILIISSFAIYQSTSIAKIIKNL